MDRFRLADRARAEVDQLSGGMAQRLMVARAIMHEPRILFLDEPTAGLDPQSRIALWDVVRELHADGQTILLTTHYMEEADQLCDRVAIMDHGAARPRHTRGLKATVGADTEVRIKRRAISTHSSRTSKQLAAVDGGRVIDDRAHVYVRPGGPALPELITHADRGRFHVTDCRRHRADARNRVHHTHRQGPARMTTRRTLAPPRGPAHRAPQLDRLRRDARRDMRVVRKQLGPFLIRTIMQPLLTTFVFTYVFPKIGQGVGGAAQSEDEFSTLLAPGLISFALIFQGIQAVALPLVNEFGYTREIDDRVIAPLPVWAVGMQKIVSGAIQAAFAAAITLPIVLLVPSTTVHLDVHWPVLVTILPLACVLAGALGLTIGPASSPARCR